MLVRLNSQFLPGWVLQGGVQYLDGEIEKAIETWERARTEGLAPMPVLILLADHYESVGRHDDARAIAQAILSLQPGFTSGGSREFLLWKEEWIPQDLEENLRSAGLP
jgi:tetratricopeptide (TPR) repeat protein